MKETNYFTTEWAKSHYITLCEGASLKSYPFKKIITSGINSDGRVELIGISEYKSVCSVIGKGDYYDVSVSSFGPREEKVFIDFLVNHSREIYIAACQAGFDITHGLSLGFEPFWESDGIENILGEEFKVYAGTNSVLGNSRFIQMTFINDDAYVTVDLKRTFDGRLNTEKLKFSGYNWREYEDIIADWITFNRFDFMKTVETKEPSNVGKIPSVEDNSKIVKDVAIPGFNKPVVEEHVTTSTVSATGLTDEELAALLSPMRYTESTNENSEEYSVEEEEIADEEPLVDMNPIIEELEKSIEDEEDSNDVTVNEDTEEMSYDENADTSSYVEDVAVTEDSYEEDSYKEDSYEVDSYEVDSYGETEEDSVDVTEEESYEEQSEDNFTQEEIEEVFIQEESTEEDSYEEIEEESNSDETHVTELETNETPIEEEEVNEVPIEEEELSIPEGLMSKQVIMPEENEESSTPEVSDESQESTSMDDILIPGTRHSYVPKSDTITSDTYKFNMSELAKADTTEEAPIEEVEEVTKDEENTTDETPIEEVEEVVEDDTPIEEGETKVASVPLEELFAIPEVEDVPEVISTKNDDEVGDVVPALEKEVILDTPEIKDFITKPNKLGIKSASDAMVGIFNLIPQGRASKKVVDVKGERL